MCERPESPYCPVKTFERFLSDWVNPSLSCLWQRPRATKHFSRFDLYRNVPLGKNTLGTFMSSISKELKLSQKYTSHCIRKYFPIFKTAQFSVCSRKIVCFSRTNKNPSVFPRQIEDNCLFSRWTFFLLPFLSPPYYFFPREIWKRGC